MDGGADIEEYDRRLSIISISAPSSLYENLYGTVLRIYEIKSAQEVRKKYRT